MFQSAFEVLQLAMNPANAVGHAWKPEVITITAGHLNGLGERGQCLRHSSQISVRKAQKKHRSQKQETIAQFRSQLPGFRLELYGELVFGLEKIETATPDQSGRQGGLIINRPGRLDNVIQDRFSLDQFSIAQMLQ